MSIISSGLSSNLQFYVSGSGPCPYLTGQVERKLFARLEGNDALVNAAINGTLCRSGFRRSHDIVYRPACIACDACVPVRIVAGQLAWSRSLRRVMARNADLLWQRATLRPDAELFNLFMRYQASRHGDSEMARMSYEAFEAMLLEGNVGTHLYVLRDKAGVLKGGMLADPVDDGLSAVYSFFEPDEARRSLGTFLILALIGEASARQLPYVYLGYWVAHSRKMMYKSRFRPLQLLGVDGWADFDAVEGLRR